MSKNNLILHFSGHSIPFHIIQFYFPTYVMIMMSLLQAKISPSIFVVRMMNDGGRTGGQWGAGCFIAPLMNKDDTIWANGAPDQES